VKRLLGGRTLRRRSKQMLDVILLAGGLGLFALTVGYACACDRL
jgi:hypothetical protein